MLPSCFTRCKSAQFSSLTTQSTNHRNLHATAAEVALAKWGSTDLQLPATNILVPFGAAELPHFKFVNSQVGNFPWKRLGTKSHCGLWTVTMLCKRKLKTLWKCGARGFMVDDSVIMLGDYNLLYLDISGHVTEGNSRLVIGYLWFVANNNTNF